MPEPERTSSPERLPAPVRPPVRGPWSHAEVADFLVGSVIPMRMSVESDSGWPIVLSLWFVPDGLELVGATRPTSTLVAQQVAARAQLDEMRQRSLTGGDGNVARPGTYL